MMEIISDNSIMAFGQYKGTAIANVPASYLLFLYRTERAGRYRDYILLNLNILEKEVMKGAKR